MAERPAEPTVPAVPALPAEPGIPGGVRPDPDGPVLVEGPVDLVLPDGTAVRSQRPVVAICACRRSKRYPFCDTSHRERSRSSDPPAPACGNDSRSDD